MKICEYIHNLTDIKFVQSLILNENNQKKIEIIKNMYENYNIYFLLRVDSLYGFYSINTTLKVRLKNIKYPYLQFVEEMRHPSILETKTVRIPSNTIDIMFR